MRRTKMKKLKIILLNQYIGAIAIGYLVARGIEMCVGAFMPAFNALLTEFLTGNAPERSYWTGVVRGSMISNLVLTGVYFLIAYLFALWLYAKPVEDSEPEAVDA
jgi:fructose-specific phosphotransferase system IIC component